MSDKHDKKNAAKADAYSRNLISNYNANQAESVKQQQRQLPLLVSSAAGAMEKADAAHRTNSITFLEKFGARARKAAFDANPELKAALDRYNLSVGEDGASSALLGKLNTDAMAAGPSAISLALEQSALDELKLGGSLSADEQRTVDQGSRAAFNDRGMVRSNPAIVSEVLNRDAAGRARLNERRAYASGVNGQLLGELGQNRDFGANVEQLNNAHSGVLANSVGVNASVDPATAILGAPTNSGAAMNAAANSIQSANQSAALGMAYQDQAFGAFMNRDESQRIANLNAQTAQQTAATSAGAAKAAGKSSQTGAMIGAGGAVLAAGLIIF